MRWTALDRNGVWQNMQTFGKLKLEKREIHLVHLKRIKVDGSQSGHIHSALRWSREGFKHAVWVERAYLSSQTHWRAAAKDVRAVAPHEKTCECPLSDVHAGMRRRVNALSDVHAGMRRRVNALSDVHTGMRRRVNALSDVHAGQIRAQGVFWRRPHFLWRGCEACGKW